MKHVAQWLVDSVWQIADMIACSPRGLYIGREHLCGEVSLVGRKGKEVTRSPNRVLLESLGPVEGDLTFVRQC